MADHFQHGCRHKIGEEILTDLALSSRVFLTEPPNNGRHPGLVSARERRARYPESAAETAAATAL